MRHGRSDLAGATGRAPDLLGVEHRWLDIPGNGGRIRLHLAEAGALDLTAIDREREREPALRLRQPDLYRHGGR